MVLSTVALNPIEQFIVQPMLLLMGVQLVKMFMVEEKVVMLEQILQEPM